MVRNQLIVLKQYKSTFKYQKKSWFMESVGCVFYHTVQSNRFCMNFQLRKVNQCVKAWNNCVYKSGNLVHHTDFKFIIIYCSSKQGCYACIDGELAGETPTGFNIVWMIQTKMTMHLSVVCVVCARSRAEHCVVADDTYYMSFVEAFIHGESI